MSRIVCLCLPLYLLFACGAYAQEPAEKLPALQEVITPHYRLTLPAPIETTTTEKVQTPWGEATKTEHMAKSGASYYIFRDFTFSSHRSPSVAKLKQARSSFLQQRKCTATDATPPPVWNNAQGKPWPQTLFAGHCAAPEQFMVLTAIAGGRVYQMQVVQDLRGKREDLPTAMTWLIDHVQLMKK